MDDSTSELEFGALIIEAGTEGHLGKLREIRRKVALQFQEICDEYRDFSGQNVLHHAAEMGHLEICKFLIQNVKVYIDASTYQRDTPLTLAAKEEHVDIVKYLISQGADVTMASYEGFTALHYAVLNDNRELVEFLLISGAPREADSVDGTPLQFAASGGNVKAVKLLLSHDAQGKANPNSFYYGFCPLSYAAREGDTEYLKSLLKAGADPNIRVTGLTRPIEDAALVHNRKGVEILFSPTKPIPRIRKWSVDGIMEFCHSEEAKTMKDLRCTVRLDSVNSQGQTSIRNKEYNEASVLFRIGHHLEPSNPKWASMGSLCHAHMNRPLHAMVHVEECLRLNTHSPNHGVGGADAAATDEIFKKYLMAGLDFKLNPHNTETDEAFRVAFFDYFASLSLMSSPEEIASLP